MRKSIENILKLQQEKIENLESKIQEQNETLDFLCKYNKDEIVINTIKDYIPCCRFVDVVNIKYIHNGKLHSVKVNYWNNREVKILKNLKNEIILSVKARSKLDEYIYFILNKSSETVDKISDDVANTLNEIHKDTVVDDTAEEEEKKDKDE